MVVADQFLPKDTSARRPAESNQRPSDNKTLAPPLSHSLLVSECIFMIREKE